MMARTLLFLPPDNRHPFIPSHTVPSSSLSLYWISNKYYRIRIGRRRWKQSSNNHNKDKRRRRCFYYYCYYPSSYRGSTVNLGILFDTSILFYSIILYYVVHK
mmetsp:Transcript_65765/g.73617  ORF Transcript_65765/g.73617 Transcript_65765/m.73617 type:complete len:103 (+) Transcript_65765:131-439(+)